MMIEKLKDKFGNKCSSININGNVTEITTPSKQMKLCEAVKYSFDVPVQINNNNLGCPGARRSSGYEKEEQKLAEAISKNSNINVSFINDALNTIPFFKDDIVNINLGLTSGMEATLPPDLFIMYVQPSKITEIIYLLAKNKIKPSLPPYSFLSICGNVFANSYLNQQVSISFGCPESRQHGGIKSSEVAVGIPYTYAELLV
jgi:uncharacterized protein (DUF169 family)